MRQNVIVTPFPPAASSYSGVSGHLLPQSQISFSNEVGYGCKYSSLALFYRTLAKPIYLRKVFAIIGAGPDFNCIIEQSHNSEISALIAFVSTSFVQDCSLYPGLVYIYNKYCLVIYHAVRHLQ